MAYFKISLRKARNSLKRVSMKPTRSMGATERFPHGAPFPHRALWLTKYCFLGSEKQYFYPDKGMQLGAHVAELHCFFSKGSAPSSFPPSYIEFFDSLKLRTHLSSQLFCKISRSFIKLTKLSGSLTLMKGPKDNMRITSSVSSLA